MKSSKLPIDQREKLMKAYREDLLKLETESKGNNEYIISERLKVWELVFDILNGRKKYKWKR